MSDNWLARFFGAMGTGVDARTETRMLEAAGVTVDADDENWRRLSTDGRRDLAPVTQRRAQELAVYLWEANRLGNRLIELPLAFLLAEGVSLQVEDPEAQGWLDEMWLDPVNRLDLTLENKARELAMYGEQCWPAFVNEISGRVRLGYIDPSLIDQVIVDPHNGALPIGIAVLKPSGKRKLYRVIVNADEDDVFPPGSPARRLRDGMVDGQCFYFRVNHLTAGRRGRPDVLSAIDWCDGYEQLLFGELERGTAMRSAIWDVTLKNATAEEVKERAKEIETPAPLSVRVHNDSETWAPLAPQLGAGDASVAARLFRNHVLGGSTIPEHWYGDGGDVNRATAGEMGEPALKVLAMRQRTLKLVLEELGRFTIRQRLAAIGRSVVDLSRDKAFQPRAVFPELTRRDLAKATTALAQLASALLPLIERGLMTEETALRAIALVAAQLGLEIDPAAELAGAREAAAKRKAADGFDDFGDLTAEPTGADEDRDGADVE